MHHYAGSMIRLILFSWEETRTKGGEAGGGEVGRWGGHNKCLPATSLITGCLCRAANNIWNFSMMMMQNDLWIADSDFHRQATLRLHRLECITLDGMHYSTLQGKFNVGICNRHIALQQWWGCHFPMSLKMMEVLSAMHLIFFVVYSAHQALSPTDIALSMQIILP